MIIPAQEHILKLGYSCEASLRKKQSLNVEMCLEKEKGAGLNLSNRGTGIPCNNKREPTPGS